MPMTVLAHGALGPFDEIIFISIAVVFVGMMGVSWFRSQQLENDDDLEATPALNIEDKTVASGEHFELK